MDITWTDIVVWLFAGIGAWFSVAVVFEAARTRRREAERFDAELRAYGRDERPGTDRGE